MFVRRAYKTELNPTERQKRLLVKHSDVCRFVWNQALRWRETEYRQTGESVPGNKIISEFRRMRAERWPQTVGVASRVEESAVRALDDAYKRFFKICRGELPRPRTNGPRKDGRPAGFPREKKDRDGVVPFAFWGVEETDVRDNAIRLQKIGWIRLKERGYLPTEGWKINRATVSEQAGRWYVSLQVEGEAEDAPRPTAAPVGVDVGVSKGNLAVVSDGRRFENPKALDKAQRRLARFQRKAARQVGAKRGQRNSKRRLRTLGRIGRLHRKVGDVRKHAQHQATSEIVGRHAAPSARPEVIGTETLNVKGMVANHKLARSVSDAGMGELLRQIGYKAEWCGIEVVKAERFYPSSKTCSTCGCINAELTLSDRSWTCPECGAIHDRDLNAAVNLANLASKPDERLNGRGGHVSPDAGQRPVKRPRAKTNARGPEQSGQPVALGGE